VRRYEEMVGKKQSSIALFLVVMTAVPCLAVESGFTQQDRERLVRLEATMNVFMEQVNKRFEQMDRRISELREDMNKRFEEVDKRFEDINKRFEDINKRFEDINKRFEDINNRFEQIINFLWMIVAIFTTLTATVIGFAYWDRRTIIKKARDEAVEAVEKEGKVVYVVQALRKLAEEDKRVAEILRNFGLL
jgi:TolA-binding protein